MATGAGAKRVFDVGLAGLIAVVAAPLFAVVALLVRLESRGPVLLPERRVGFRGQSFLAWRFRTVLVAGEESGPVEDDPCLTRLGGFLRATRLDCLPRLWNVLKGEMSVVGPRAHASGDEEAFAFLAADYWRRQHARPGMTGLAQVRRRLGGADALEDLRAELDSDLEYVSRWSAWLDVSILARTVLQTRAL